MDLFITCFARYFGKICRIFHLTRCFKVVGHILKSTISRMHFFTIFFSVRFLRNASTVYKETWCILITICINLFKIEAFKKTYIRISRYRNLCVRILRFLRSRLVSHLLSSLMWQSRRKQTKDFNINADVGDIT